MSRLLARLALVICVCGFSLSLCRAEGSESSPSIKVAIVQAPSSVTTGDPIKGSVDVTLSGFSKPVNVFVSAGLAGAPDKDWADVPRLIALHSRPNGTYRLSLSGDLDVKATYAVPPQNLRVTAEARSERKRFNGVDSRPIEVFSAAENNYFANIALSADDSYSLRIYSFPLKKQAKFLLNYSIFCQNDIESAGEIKESVKISGPAQITFPARSHKVNRANNGYAIHSPYEFTFPVPGEYRVEYELSMTGGKTLTGREMAFVAEPVIVTLDAASPGLGRDLKAVAGTPFGFLVRFSAGRVSESLYGVVESIEFVGPESVKLEPQRFLEGPGDLSWESSYEVKLVKPGSYRWTVKLSPATGSPPNPISGTVTVEAPSPGGQGNTWTRAGGVNDTQYIQDLKVGSSSVSWTAPDKDGKSATSTLTWSEPPGTLTLGQTVPLKLSFTAWTGPTFEARVFSYAFEGGRTNILSASANNSTRLTGERSFTFQGPQPGDPQDQVTIVLQVNYRTGDFSGSPTNRLYRSWVYRRGGRADVGAAEIKDKTVLDSISPRDVASTPRPPANTGALSRSSVTQSVGGLTIGMREGVLVVTEVKLQTGADIKAGDQILQINGKDTISLTMEQVTALLKDPDTRQTTLKIKRSDGTVVTMVSAKRSS